MIAYRRFARGSVAGAVALMAAGGAAAQLNCNVGVEFYPDGALKSCYLNGNHALHTRAGQRVVCADGQLAEQYPDGALASCGIGQPQVFGETRCDAPGRVEFEPDGTLRACRKS